MCGSYANSNKISHFIFNNTFRGTVLDGNSILLICTPLVLSLSIKKVRFLDGRKLISNSAHQPRQTDTERAKLVPNKRIAFNNVIYKQNRMEDRLK